MKVKSQNVWRDSAATRIFMVTSAMRKFTKEIKSECKQTKRRFIHDHVLQDKNSLLL